MSSRRKSIRKPTKKATSKKVSITAKSSKTGIVHIFEDLKEAEKLAKKLRAEKDSKRQGDLINSLAFWVWLNRQTFTAVADTKWSSDVFRLVYGGFSPTSIVGNIGDGGRFNIGSAQMCSEFSELRKSGCLYTASTLSCCYSEASGPIGKPTEYKLTPKKELQLWDLAKVISSLNRVGLEEEVASSPLSAIWAYQKVPMISQLLVHYLRSVGGDGVFYPSTKDSSALNIAFFFLTDEEAAAAFTVLKIN
jgi:hypothetical protein